MNRQIIQVSCGNCGEDIRQGVLNLTDENLFDVDMTIDSTGFDCDHCGKTTGISVIKEVF